MKKRIALALVFLLVASQLTVSFAATTPMAPKMISAAIERVTDKAILVKSGAGVSLVLNITDDTLILNAVTGEPMQLKDRIGDSLVAYYGPAETKSMPAQSNAVVLLLSLPQDYAPPKLAIAEAVETTTDGMKVTFDNGNTIATIAKATPVTAYKTGKAIPLDTIAVGTKALLWYDIVALSQPAQAVPTKVVVLADAPVSPVDVAPAVAVTDKALTTSAQLKGKLPMFAIAANKTLQDNVNAMVTAAYDSAMKLAAAQKDSTLTFSYDVTQTPAYTSVAITSAISAGNTESHAVIETIVIDNTKMAVVNLTDVLGMNAYKLATLCVKNVIANAPQGSYNTDSNAFTAVTEANNFVMNKDGNAVILFDKYSIAPGAAGMPMFVIDQTLFQTTEMANIENYVEKYTTMIPVRKVAEQFGYTVTWQQATKTITLTKGTETHSMILNKNQYGNITLEHAPTLTKGITYVPLSFFEKVLGGITSSTESKVVYTKLK